jgi:hypothetical protein
MILFEVMIGSCQCLFSLDYQENIPNFHFELRIFKHPNLEFKFHGEVLLCEFC